MDGANNTGANAVNMVRMARHFLELSHFLGLPADPGNLTFLDQVS